MQFHFVSRSPVNGNRVTTFAFLLLSWAILLTVATKSPAQAPITAKDLVGTWKIKDKGNGAKVGSIELLKNGEFKLTVGDVRYATDSTTKWEFDSKDLKILLAPNNTATLLMRGNLDKYTKAGKNASFELTLKETNRIPVKAGTVLLFEK